MSNEGVSTIDLLLAYYGDDFTGSTDVLEALTISGVETVLFVEPPGDEMLRRYAHVRAIGLAGTSRTMSPDEMDTALPEVFYALREHEPRIMHYKVCSTFDSSPEIGSIGRAIDIGQRVFENRFVPLVVGAPVLERFCVFGNLFARSGLDSPPFRLDRHPTMCSHPVTPMTESDLRVHLSRQTSRPIELVDVTVLERGYDAATQELDRVLTSPGSVVLFDTLTDTHLATIGQLVWETQERKPLFVAGSSGIEYALTKHWRAAGVVPGSEGTTRMSRPTPRSVDRTLVLSGSCSPVTDRQIAWALEHGFAEVPLDVASWFRSSPSDAEIAATAKQIVSTLHAGRSVVAHTSRGPTDPRIKAMDQTVGPAGRSAMQISVILGSILREVVRARVVQRVAMVGGDTSGQVARSLGIAALEFAGSLDPGAPLCIAHSRDPAIEGLEVAFKGGQVGYDDFFGTLLRGHPSRSPMGASR